MDKVGDERNWSSPSQVVTVGGEGSSSEMGDLWEEANVTGQFLFYLQMKRDIGE